MDLPRACKPTTDNTIPNTSEEGSGPGDSEQPTNREPIDFEQRTGRAARKSNTFTLLDLERVLFTLDGNTILNALAASNEAFGTFALIVADVTNVDTWHIENRRDFLNGLWAFCEEHGYDFPFTVETEETISTALLAAEQPKDREGHA